MRIPDTSYNNIMFYTNIVSLDIRYMHLYSVYCYIYVYIYIYNTHITHISMCYIVYVFVTYVVLFRLYQGWPTLKDL